MEELTHVRDGSGQTLKNIRGGLSIAGGMDKIEAVVYQAK